MIKSSTLFALFSGSMLLLASCSNPESKFEGQWTPYNYEGNLEFKDTLTLKKDKKVYRLSTKTNDEIGSFVYDKEREALTMDTGREIVDIEYNRDSKRLVLKQRGGWGNEHPELERVK